jgi:hypothetical protein
LPNKRRDEDEKSVSFRTSEAASSRSSRPGPKPRDESQRALVESGDAKWFKAALPTEVHRKLHVEAILRETTASEIVAEALLQYLHRKK